MTTLHETAYPRLKADPTPKELREVYTPTENELAFVFDAIQRPASRLAVLLHLKLFQRLGYFTRLTEVPDTIKNHVARAAGYLKLPPAEQLDRYDDSGAKRAHMGLLRQFLNVRVLDDTGRTWLRSIAEDAAETKNDVPDIINIMLEELVHHRYELRKGKPRPVLLLKPVRLLQMCRRGSAQRPQRDTVATPQSSGAWWKITTSIVHYYR
jgi:hypothetical protein